jgi:hypothetical protein
MNDWAGNGISLTLESSVRKLLDEQDLARHWRYCKEALLMSYEYCYHAGLHGVVTDGETGEPIFEAEVTRIGDTLTSDVNGLVYTDSCGKYVKYQNDGTHKFIFRKEGYQTHEEPNINIPNYMDRVDLNVKLWKEGTAINGSSELINNTITVTPVRKGVRITTGKLGKNALVGIYSLSGKLVTMLPASNTVWEGKGSNGKVVSNGCYIVKVKSGNQSLSKSFVLNR